MYIAPPNMPAYFSATVANLWIQNNTSWLWPQATKAWDTFTGVVWNTNITAAETTIYRGYFRYQGVKANVLLGKTLIGGGGTIKLYVTDDGGETMVASASDPSQISFPVDLSARSFTSGSHYSVRITSTGASATCTVYYLAILTANALSYPTLPAWTDGTTPSLAQWNMVPTAQNYCDNLIVPFGSSCKMTFSWNVGTPKVFCAGGFYYRAGTMGGQRTITPTWRGWPADDLTLRVYDSSGALQDTIALTSDKAEHTQAFTLAGTYTANTFCTYTVSSNNGYADRTYVTRVVVGGALALQNTPVPYAQGDTVKGTSGTQRMAWIGKQNLDDIRDLLRGTGSDNGFQYLAPDQSLGTLTWDPVTSAGVTVGTTAQRDYVAGFPYLYYLPTASGATGTLIYRGQNVSLSDSNNGGWNAYSLAALADLAPGTTLTIDAVKACYMARS